MYSVKPGRGPSLISAMASLVAAIFGMVWVYFALAAGSPWPFAAFGIFFVVAAGAGVLYNFFNATQPNRLSAFDVTASGEESDPIADALGLHPTAAGPRDEHSPPRRVEGGFCPYCGAAVQDEFAFCPKCGKDI